MCVGAGMAAKPKLVGTFQLVAILLSLLVGCREHSVNAQAPDVVDGSIYLDAKEANVKAIAGNATLNDKSCDGLSNCSAACSRVACHAIDGDQKSLICTKVDNNEHFDLCESRYCRDQMLLEYNRSFVTLPAPGYTTLQPEVATDICLQRGLDSTFQTVSSQQDYSLVYFGSVSGAFRAFPGRGQNATQCTNFDPRRRPWYLNGISVHKDVKILVDVAVSMGDPVPVQYQQDSRTTYLNVTQNITRGLLQTFAPGDYVEVLSFDSQGATSLMGKPVSVASTFNYQTPDRVELLPLIGLVNNLTASQHVSPSNLTGAIATAIAGFTAASYSKVIIVLTNGQFAPLDAAFPTQQLKSSQTKLMMYKLPQDTDSSLLNTSLRTTVCSVNGSFELLIPVETANPLYAMRSYFTFLAQTQLVAANNQPTWSYKYASVSQGLNAITVTYPVTNDLKGEVLVGPITVGFLVTGDYDVSWLTVFGSDGKLVGVAGVDVVVDNLNTTLKGLVLSDFNHRRQGSLPVPTTILMSCNYQVDAESKHCPNAPSADDTAICQDPDDSISLASITCCGKCGAGPKKKWSTGAIAGLVVGVVGGALLLALLVFCLWRRRNPPPPPPGPDVWQGTDQDDD